MNFIKGWPEKKERKKKIMGKNKRFTVMKFVRMDQDMADKLKDLADIRKSSETQVIRDALMALFEKYYDRDLKSAEK